MIVADTNTIAYLFLPSDYTEDVEALLAKDSNWIAPMLWRSELRNILALYLRKNLLSFENALAIQQQAELLLKHREHVLSSQDVLKIAMESACSAYDAEFIALAINKNCKLVTADKKILKSFPDVAVMARDYLA